MEYNKEIKQEEIPEFALQPARPAETEVLTEKKEESFDASAYDKLFEEMARLKESFAEEVRKGNAEIEAQEAAARAGWEEPAFEEKEVISQPEETFADAGNSAVPAVTELRAEEPTAAELLAKETATAEPVMAAPHEEEPKTAESAMAVSHETEPKTAELLAKETTAAEPRAEKPKELEREPGEQEYKPVIAEEKPEITAKDSPDFTAEGEDSGQISAVEPIKIKPAGSDVISGQLKFTDFRSLPSARVHIEEDLLVPDVKPDLSSILTMEGDCRLSENEFQMGSSGRKEFRVNGELALQILYLPMEEEADFIPLFSAVPFRDDIAAPAEAESKVCVSAVIENLDWEVINERKYRVKADLYLEAREYRNVSLDLFRGIKGNRTQLRKETVPVTEVALRKKDVIELSEEMPLKDGRGEIGEILSWNAKAVETHRQISEDKAVISGAIHCSVLYRNREGQENAGKPELYRGKSEFTQFIKLNGEREFLPAAGSRAVFSLKNAALEAEDGEDGIRDRFRFTADLETELEIYKDEELEVVTDLYDPERDVCYDTEEVEVSALRGSGLSETGIREIFNVPERFGTAEQVLFLSGTPILGKAFAENGKGVAEGAISVKLVCRSEESASPFVITQMLPFRCSVNVPGAEDGMDTDCTVTLKDLWFDRINSRQVEVNGSLSVSMSVYGRRVCPLIKNLTFADSTAAASRPSVVVYVAREGDNLWKVAKRYRMSLEGMKEVNGIADGETIRPGTKLLIVK